MNQLGLDFTNTPRDRTAPGRKEEPARSRRNDPATSQRAASKVRQFETGHFSLILDALIGNPGTAKEIAQRSGLDYVAVARRMNELQQAGKVYLSGEVRDGCREWRRA